jgi:hypothetical protein
MILIGYILYTTVITFICIKQFVISVTNKKPHNLKLFYNNTKIIGCNETRINVWQEGVLNIVFF